MQISITPDFSWDTYAEAIVYVQGDGANEVVLQAVKKALESNRHGGYYKLDRSPAQISTQILLLEKVYDIIASGESRCDFFQGIGGVETADQNKLHKTLLLLRDCSIASRVSGVKFSAAILDTNNTLSELVPPDAVITAQYGASGLLECRLEPYNA